MIFIQAGSLKLSMVQTMTDIDSAILRINKICSKLDEIYENDTIVEYFDFILGATEIDVSQIEGYYHFPEDYRQFAEKVGLIGWQEGYVGPEMCQPFRLRELTHELEDYLSGAVSFKDDKYEDFFNQLDCSDFVQGKISEIAFNNGIEDWFLISASSTHHNYLFVSTDQEPYKLMESAGSLDRAMMTEIALTTWLEQQFFGYSEAVKLLECAAFNKNFNKDRNATLNVASEYGYSLRYMTDEFSRDPEIIEAALKSNPHSRTWVDSDMLKNPRIAPLLKRRR